MPSIKPIVDLSAYTNDWWSPGATRCKIALWRGLGRHLFRLIPNEPYFERFFNDLRCAILRAFGAGIGRGVVIRSTCEVYYPWNLIIGDHAWIGYGANLYNLTSIHIGCNACVSQNSYLCTGSHDASDPYMGLIVGEIVIEDGAWICADCFIHPGVTIGEQSVIGAGSVVTRDMPPGKLCAGNPCVAHKDRAFKHTVPGTGGGIKKGREMRAPRDRCADAGTGPDCNPAHLRGIEHPTPHIQHGRCALAVGRWRRILNVQGGM